VLDPSKLEYVILLHFEADETGGMDGFLEGAPNSTLAGSAMTAILNLSGWNYSGRVEGHTEGEVIDLGKHELRFLETPHVHHWDSMMLFDETTKSVFPSDLFIQPGDQPPVVTEDLGRMMCEYYRQIGIFAHDQPVRDVVDRIEALDPDWIHGTYGGSLGRGRSPTSSARCRRSRSVIKASCSAERSCRSRAGSGSLPLRDRLRTGEPAAADEQADAHRRSSAWSRAHSAKERAGSPLISSTVEVTISALQRSSPTCRGQWLPAPVPHSRISGHIRADPAHRAEPCERAANLVLERRRG
jgi:glyoxylase-like metal-dependent hydrolase (beta-lactamase superfamily II)